MSRSEGTPNPCLEAAASGVTLLSTAVGNMPEFITDGENGWLLPRDQAALQAALVRLRDDVALRQRAGQHARATALGWSWAVQAEAFARMFRTVLSGSVPPVRRWTPDVSICVPAGSERAHTAELEGALSACAAAGLRCEVVVGADGSDIAGMPWFEARAQGEAMLLLGEGFGAAAVADALAKLRGGAVLVTAAGRRGALVARRHLRTFAIAPQEGGAALQWDALGRLLRGRGLLVATS
jgi:hypothetical protein